MKNIDVIKLNNALGVVGKLIGVKFAYAVNRNINVLKPIMESIQKAVAPKEEYEAYEKGRISLAEKMATKGKDKKPLIENNQYVLDDTEAFDKELKKLQTIHKKAIDDRKQQEKEAEKLAEEEVKVELFKVKMSDIPPMISVEQMAGIYQLIEE